MSQEPDKIDTEFLNSAIRLNIKLLGLVFGLVSGLVLFFITLLAHIKGGGEHLNLLSVFLIGYSVSIEGAFIGFFWAFIIGGLSGAFLYLTYSKSLGSRIAEVVTDGEEKNVFFNHQILKIEGRSLSLAAACVITLLLILSTNLLVLRGTADESIHAALLSFYLPGYTVSFVGSIIGGIQLFAVTYISFLVFGYTYNNIADYRHRNSVRLFYYKPKLQKPETITPSSHVCILGAGPAGLATGHELSANNTKVTLLEKMIMSVVCAGQ